jgi:hypothetical protein
MQRCKDLKIQRSTFLKINGLTPDPDKVGV